MELKLEIEPPGRLHCSITQRGQTTSFSAYDGAAALNMLDAATDDLLRLGYGECYWELAKGNYRLLFRRTDEDGDLVRIAVLWGNCSATGWEHILWSVWDASDWFRALREAMLAVGHTPEFTSHLPANT